MNKPFSFRVSFFKTGSLFVIFLFLIVPLFPSAQAQTAVSKTCNGLRAGDRLVKQQVEYKDPGRKGENVLWDFSEQQPLDDHYRLNYYGVTDSLVVGEEHNALYRFLSGGDSLLLSRVENRTTLIEYRKPELQLVYPMIYGDRYEDYFHGNGDYGNRLFITARGKVSVEADASGMLLLPQGDTLRNVLRIRHLKTLSEQMVPYPFIQSGDTVFSSDTIEARLTADTLLIQVETYRWYVPGWRYPVFETVSNRYLFPGGPKEYSRSSFYYKPVDQYYDLENDPANREVREEAQERLRTEAEKSVQDGSGGTLPQEIIQYDASLSDGNNTLNLEYCLNGDSEVSFLLFDMQGRQLTFVQKGRQAAGFYRETISLSGLQPGEYTLRIVVGEQVFGVKIIK